MSGNLVYHPISFHLRRSSSTGHLIRAAIPYTPPPTPYLYAYQPISSQTGGYLYDENPYWDSATQTYTEIADLFFYPPPVSDQLLVWRGKDETPETSAVVSGKLEQVKREIKIFGAGTSITYTITFTAAYDGKEAIAKFIYSGGVEDPAEDDEPNTIYFFPTLTSSDIDDGGLPLVIKFTEEEYSETAFASLEDF